MNPSRPGLLEAVSIPSTLGGTAWDTGVNPEEARRLDCLRAVERGSGVATACGACGSRATAEVCDVQRPGQPAVRRWVLRCWRVGYPGCPPCPVVVLEVAEGEVDPEWPAPSMEGQDPCGRREPLLVRLLAVKAPVRRKRGAERPPREKRSCEECGEVFQPGTARARYCSLECRGRANKRAWRNKKREAAQGLRKEETVSTTERKCEECEGVFTLRRRDQRFCGAECRRVGVRRRELERQREDSPGRVCEREGCGRPARRGSGSRPGRFCSKSCAARVNNATRAARSKAADEAALALSPPEPQEQPLATSDVGAEAGASRPLAGRTGGEGGLPEGGDTPVYEAAALALGSRTETEGEWELVDGLRRPPCTPHHSRAVERRVEEWAMEFKEAHRATAERVARLEARADKQSIALQDVDRKLSERLDDVQAEIGPSGTLWDSANVLFDRVWNLEEAAGVARPAGLIPLSPPHDPPGWTWEGLAAVLCDLTPEEVEATVRFAAVMRAREDPAR